MFPVPPERDIHPPARIQNAAAKLLRDRITRCDQSRRLYWLQYPGGFGQAGRRASTASGAGRNRGEAPQRRGTLQLSADDKCPIVRRFQIDLGITLIGHRTVQLVEGRLVAGGRRCADRRPFGRFGNCVEGGRRVESGICPINAAARGVAGRAGTAAEIGHPGSSGFRNSHRPVETIGQTGPGLKSGSRSGCVRRRGACRYEYEYSRKAWRKPGLRASPGNHLHCHPHPRDLCPVLSEPIKKMARFCVHA